AKVVEIRVAQPIGRRLHSAGNFVAQLRRASFGLERDTPTRTRRRAGEIVLCSAASLPQTIGARVERVGQRVLQVAGAVPHRRSDVSKLVLRRTGQIASAIGETMRLLTPAFR